MALVGLVYKLQYNALKVRDVIHEISRRKRGHFQNGAESLSFLISCDFMNTQRRFYIPLKNNDTIGTSFDHVPHIDT